MKKLQICSIDNCDSPFYAKKLCNKHYIRLWKYGSTEDRGRGLAAASKETRIRVARLGGSASRGGAL